MCPNKAKLLYSDEGVSNCHVKVGKRCNSDVVNTKRLWPKTFVQVQILMCMPFHNGLPTIPLITTGGPISRFQILWRPEPATKDVHVSTPCATWALFSTTLKSPAPALKSKSYLLRRPQRRPTTNNFISTF